MVKKKNNEPKFKFEKDIIDYGRVDQHSNGTRVFEFTNVGKSPLIIKDIKTSCDCTIPKIPKEPILPGEKGTIEVVYDTSKLGGFYKMITIFSNSKTKVYQIKIKGIVLKKKSVLIKEKGLLESN